VSIIHIQMFTVHYPLIILCYLATRTEPILVQYINIVNFPFLCSNIPVEPANGVCISKLIPYYRTCGSYRDVLDSG
jgi:hypothetical protein